MIGYLYNFFSNKKNINLAFLLRPSVKLDDLSIQVASTLSQEEVLSRIQEVKDRVRPKAFFTEQSVNPLTWRRKPEVWRRRTRTQVLEDMMSEQFSLHCTLSRIRGLFTQDNYCCDFWDINWTFWKWWFANITRSGDWILWKVKKAPLSGSQPDPRIFRAWVHVGSNPWESQA